MTTAFDLASFCSDLDATDVVASFNALADSISEHISRGGSGSACAIASILMHRSYVDASYGNATAAEDVNWSSTCWLPAKCYVRPASNVEVAFLLQVIRLTASRFAIKNTGHNPNPGFASIGEDGVLIDIRSLNQIQRTADHSALRLGAGALWDDVYASLDAEGLYAAGPRYTGVGVSGSILGCAIPIIPSLAGLACDNIRNFEVVLSSGEIINANAKEHPDLFRSLKGGTNNFGVVTSFDISPIKSHDLWYKGLSFPTTDYQAVLPAIAQTQINMESDDKAGIIIQAGLRQIQITFLYAEHVRASPATFAPLDTLNGNVTVPSTNSTALNFSRSVSAPEPPGSRAAAGVTSLVDVPLYIAVFEQFLRLQHYSSSPGTGLALVIQQFGAAAVRAGIAQNNNSLGLAAVPQNW